MLGRTDFYYFSPTGGTKKAEEIFCREISSEVQHIDLGQRGREPEEPKGELTVFAAPVFGGRVPEAATAKMKKLDGTGKKAVTLAVYGNRAYEDALLELNQTAEEQGFQVIASAALIAQHSMAPEVGQGRPDGKDQEEICEFAQKVLQKLEQPSENSVKVPGNYPYKPAMNMPVAPLSLDSCTRCGKCADVCPTEAISMEDTGAVTDPQSCILCMACTASCPEHARILPPPLKEKMEQMLGALKNVRRENEFFL